MLIFIRYHLQSNDMVRRFKFKMITFIIVQKCHINENENYTTHQSLNQFFFIIFMNLLMFDVDPSNENFRKSCKKNIHL